MKKIVFEKILERDVDLLVINNLLNGKLLDLFLNTINRSGYIIDSIEHSHRDEDGEKDITVYLSNNNKRLALLIEDKITAPAMEKQAERYGITANKIREEGVETFDFIIAPEKYLTTNSEASKYSKKISYETIRKYLDDEYSLAIIDKALDESTHGYEVVANEPMTEFWRALYRYLNCNYKGQFDINYNEEPKGYKSTWFYFKIRNKINIIYMFNKGKVQLVFDKVSSKYYELRQKFIEKGVPEIEIKSGGKNLVIERIVDSVDLKKSFRNNEEKVNNALKVVSELQTMFHKLKLEEDYNIVMKS